MELVKDVLCFRSTQMNHDQILSSRSNYENTSCLGQRGAVYHAPIQDFVRRSHARFEVSEVFILHCNGP